MKIKKRKTNRETAFKELGRSCFTFIEMGSRRKIILRSTRKYLKGAGKISALFPGSKGVMTTPIHRPSEPFHCLTYQSWDAKVIIIIYIRVDFF